MKNQLEELTEYLRSKPTGVDISLKLIPTTDLERVLNGSHVDITATLSAVGDLIDARVQNGDNGTIGHWSGAILAIPHDHPFARSAVKLNCSAVWGCASGRFAFSYGESAKNKHLLWHEALHALGADDCYVLPNVGPTCCTPNCIMQYAPTEINVGQWPFICHCNSQKIIARLKKYLG